VIGVDTNVLLRGLVDQDEPQTRLARELMGTQATRRDLVYVNHVVLAEAVWTLRRFGKLSRAHIVDFLEGLLRTPHVALADRELVVEALDTYRQGRADFADILIGLLNRAAGCRTTYTFDRGAAELPAYSPVPHA
jgi:predicted nucleic-acid-binding protein